MYPTKFIGEDLSDVDCDLIALDRFDTKLFKGENELQQSCWFDYRYLHPIKRSYLFSHFYVEAFKAAYEKFISDKTEKVFGLSRPKDPLDNRPNVGKTRKLSTPTMLIRARQVCDSMQIPYEFFTTIGLRIAVRERFNEMLISSTKDDRARLNISPCSLYNDKILAKIEKQWKEISAQRMYWCTNERLVFSKDERELVGVPHLYKLDLERYVLKHILNRTLHTFLINKSIDKGFLRTAVAKRVFPAERSL